MEFSHVLWKKIPALALSKLSEIRNGEVKSFKLGDFKYKMTKQSCW